MSIEKRIVIHLDKERHFILDLNAMEKFLELTGINILQGIDLTTLKPQDLKTLTWVCLIDEDPELTLEVVSHMVHTANILYVLTTLGKVISLAIPESEGPPDPNPLNRPPG